MLFLALKHLFSHKRQTLLTLLGIVLGSGAYVTISGFMLGFRGFLMDQLINNEAHVKISARDTAGTADHLKKTIVEKSGSYVFWLNPVGSTSDVDYIQNPQGWFSILRNDPRVTAYSPQLIVQGLASLASKRVSINLLGCEPSQQSKISDISKYITAGKFSDLAIGGNRIILGINLAEKLGAQINQTISISVGNSLPIPFRVVGIFRLGIKNIDDSRAYAWLPDVQKLFLRGPIINEIGLRVNDVSSAASIASFWNGLSTEKVLSWDQVNESVLSVFKIQDVTRYLMITVILVVASSGIYNMMNVSVNQKKKDIAILRSIGFEPNEITSLFFSQGAILGFIGGFVGLFVGYLACLYLQTIPFGGGPMGGTGYMVISFDLSIYLAGFLLGVLTSILASIIPARAAGRFTPIDIIRAGAE